MTQSENQQVADLFDTLADFLELKGENLFKVKAYQKAARTIQALGTPVSELRGSGELTRVGGIGKAIAEKISEYLDTGVVGALEELKSSFPPQILDLMDVPGLGAKKAAVLYHELGIGDLDALEKAIGDGRIRALKGFGAKSETRLLEGLQLLRQGEERVGLGRATEIAYHIRAVLEAIPGVEWVRPAGSLRRGKETVADLDLVCVAPDSQAAMTAFCALSSDVVARGETRSTIRWQGRVQVDLRVVPAASAGAAMQYFTGSKDHNVALRALCEKRGFKLNEYGLFDNATGSAVAGETEEGIYAALGLPWFPPELRESGQELGWERVPSIVELRQVRGNLHTHSVWSDGTDTLRALAEKAMSLGYDYLAVTDHSRSLVVANGLSVERLLEQGEAIAALNEEFGERFRLLWGTECDILAGGSLDFPDEVLARLDLVVAAVHSSMQQSKEDMTARILRAVRHPQVHILAHPTGRRLNKRHPYQVDWDEVFRAGAAAGTAFELNCSPRRLDLNDLACRRARELGCRFSLGTDAHALPEFDSLPLGLAQARRACLEPADLLNTRTLPELLDCLKRPSR